MCAVLNLYHPFTHTLIKKKKKLARSFPAVQWLRAYIFTAVALIQSLAGNLDPTSYTMWLKKKKINEYPLQYSCLKSPMDGGAW